MAIIPLTFRQYSAECGGLHETYHITEYGFRIEPFSAKTKFTARRDPRAPHFDNGYHLTANICQSDEQVCELPHGIGVRTWNHSKNEWGDCIATKCEPGYTMDSSLTNEYWEQCGRCNNMYAENGELAVSGYVDGCEIAACMYQGEKYALVNNECLFICPDISVADDGTGSQHWDDDTKKCVRECAPGYMKW